MSSCIFMHGFPSSIGSYSDLISLLLFSGVSVSTPLAVVLQWTWNILMSTVQLSSGEDGICAWKSHMCSALSLKKEVVLVGGC